MIPIGRRYTATAQARIWKPVHCQHCGCDFLYQIQVKAQSSRMSPLFLANDEASAGARWDAAQQFKHKADTAQAVVRCPDCGQYQAAMVAYRKQRWLLLALAVYALLVLLLAQRIPAAGNLLIYLVGGAFLGTALLRSQWAAAAFIGLIGVFIAHTALKDVLDAAAALNVLVIASVLLGGFALWLYRYDPNARVVGAVPPDPRIPVMRRQEYLRTLAQPAMPLQAHPKGQR